MENEEITSGIIGIFSFMLLLIYAFTSSGITLFLHTMLLIGGLSISILMINKITKSSNSLKTKIYSSFILNFLLFFSIVFFWFLGNHHSIDDKGLMTFLIIIPSSILFGFIGFIVGLVLSVKRRERNDFDYNLKYLLTITSLLFLLLLLIFFYNPAMRKMAITFEDESLCRSTLITSNSYMFAPSFYSDCMMRVGIAKQDIRICDDVCDNLNIDQKDCQINDKSQCYHNVAREKGDIESCVKAAIPAYCVLAIAEDTKNIQLCEHLAGGANPRVEFSGSVGRDYCLSTLAPIIGDITLCNSINNNETKQYCIQNYNSSRPKLVID